MDPVDPEEKLRAIFRSVIKLGLKLLTIYLSDEVGIYIVTNIVY